MDLGEIIQNIKDSEIWLRFEDLFYKSQKKFSGIKDSDYDFSFDKIKKSHFILLEWKKNFIISLIIFLVSIWSLYFFLNYSIIISQTIEKQKIEKQNITTLEKELEKAREMVQNDLKINEIEYQEKDDNESISLVLNRLNTLINNSLKGSTEPFITIWDFNRNWDEWWSIEIKNIRKYRTLKMLLTNLYTTKIFLKPNSYTINAEASELIDWWLLYHVNLNFNLIEL